MRKDDLIRAVTKAKDGDLVALADLLKQDRLDRQLTYPEYAAFLDVKLSTLHKIMNQKTRKPHDLTLAQIQKKLTRAKPAADPMDEPVADPVADPGDASDDHEHRF